MRPRARNTPSFARRAELRPRELRPAHFLVNMETISDHFQAVLEDGEHFWPLSKWPKVAKDDMLKKHKLRNERYYLTRFLCFNGLPPKMAMEWILREGTYDEAAIRDQVGLTNKASTEDFYKPGKIFSMAYGRSMRYNEPPPALPYQQNNHPVVVPPPEEQLPKTYGFKDLIKDVPAPKRADYPDEFEHHLANVLWKAEIRSYIQKKKDAGYVYVD